MAYFDCIGHGKVHKDICSFSSFLSLSLSTRMVHFVITVCVLLISITHAQESMSTNSIIEPTTVSDTTCDNVDNSFDCMNGGVCVMLGTKQTCRCSSEYFTGSECGIINLQLPAYDVFETGIMFNWTGDIFNFQDYFGVFTRTPLNEGSIVYSMPVNLISTNNTGVLKSSIKIDGMEPDQKEYLACVIHKDYIGELILMSSRTINNEMINISMVNTSLVLRNNLMKSEYLNCGVLVTSFDRFGPFTLAALIIGIVLPSSVVLAIIIRGL